MNRTKRVLLLTAFTALAPIAHASAQSTPTEDKFVTLSAGGQVQTRSFSSTTTFPLYDETATVNASQKVGKGLVVDATGAYRFRQRLYAGLGLSVSRGKGDASVQSSIPDPTFFNKFTNSSTSLGDLTQTVLAITPQAIWVQPVNDKIDVAIQLGWSLAHVKQEVPTVNVVAGTSNSTATSQSESKWTGKAGLAGVNVTYKVTDKYAVGVFVRYHAGEADLPSASKLKFGGTQAGIGLKLHF